MDASSVAHTFTSLSTLLNVIAAAILWRTTRPMEGPGYWYFATFLSLLVAVLFAFNARFPNFAFVFGGNLSLWAAVAMMAYGVVRFTEENLNIWVLGAPMVPLTLAMAYYCFVDPDLSWRFVLSGVGAALYSFILVSVLLRWQVKQHDVSSTTIMALICWTLFGLANASRSFAGWYMLGINPAKLFNSPGYLLIFIVTPILTTGGILSLGLLTVQRLVQQRERAAYQARESADQANDLAERFEAMADQYRKLATYDSLTQVYNRRLFFDRAREELRRCQREVRGFGLIMMDLDHFKSINDQFGHAAGDEVLRQTGLAIRDHLREFDVSGRLGGEEFALALSDTELVGAVAVAERLRSAIENLEILHDGKKIPVSASFGVVAHRGREMDFDKLLDKADQALYAAKNAGRNRVTAINV